MTQRQKRKLSVVGMKCWSMCGVTRMGRGGIERIKRRVGVRGKMDAKVDGTF